jgi:SAM-dependent methyltransferase
MQADLVNVIADYDRMAVEYAHHVYGELNSKPFDCDFLDRFASAVGDRRVCEVGCGPGQVSRYLHERGCDVFGIDISPRMIELAGELNPAIDFQVADLGMLAATERDLGGIVSFYSLIHLDIAQLTAALEGFRQALVAGGRLVLALHEGAEARQPAEIWGIPISLQYNFFTYEQITDALRASDFTIETITHRAPYPDIEVETDRLYASAIAN